MNNLKLKFLNLNNSSIDIVENTKYVGLFIGKSDEQLSSALNFIHTIPNLTSSIHIKAVLFDNAQLNFRGNLAIKKGAIKTNTYLKIDVLLLSKNAKAIATPSLEIQENDVKAGHGATIGTIDQDQFFYLQSRGFDKAHAEKIIAEGFVHEVKDLFQSIDVPTDLLNELKKFNKNI